MRFNSSALAPKLNEDKSDLQESSSSTSAPGKSQPNKDRSDINRSAHENLQTGPEFPAFSSLLLTPHKVQPQKDAFDFQVLSSSTSTSFISTGKPVQNWNFQKVYWK